MVDVWRVIAAERRAFADLLEGLTPEQWRTPSLCPAWTAHDVVAHLVSVQELRPVATVTAVVAARGVPRRVAEVLVGRYADRTPQQLVAGLREHAEGRFTPPGLGPRAALTDLMVHRLDVAVPLGITVERPPEPWAEVLDFFLSPLPMLGMIRTRRPRVSYRATDLDWQGGSGPEVAGPAHALGSVVAGRAALLPLLEGPGVAALRRWLD